MSEFQCALGGGGRWAGADCAGAVPSTGGWASGKIRDGGVLGGGGRQQPPPGRDGIEAARIGSVRGLERSRQEPRRGTVSQRRGKERGAREEGQQRPSRGCIRGAR